MTFSLLFVTLAVVPLFNSSEGFQEREAKLVLSLEALHLSSPSSCALFMLLCNSPHPLILHFLGDFSYLLTSPSASSFDS